MADAAARAGQYDYKANSNLVLQADTRLIERRHRDEATGEVQSLSGKIKETRMGDRFHRNKPFTGEDAAAKKKKRSKNDSSSYEISKLKGKSLLSEGIDQIEGILYRPKTPATKETYEVILSFLQEVLGHQARDVLYGAADEVLATVKNEKIREKERRRELDSLLGTRLPEDKYILLVGLCKKITDFGTDDSAALQSIEDAPDETYGVNVQFEESDEEDSDNEELLHEIKDDDEDEDGEEAQSSMLVSVDLEKIPASGTATVLGSGISSTIPGMASVLPGMSSSTLGDIPDPREIDAYWLQRKLSKTIADAESARIKAKEVLEILESASDDRELETRLIDLLGFTQFDFIKLLKRNKSVILYCTLLASAQSAGEKKSIRRKMTSDPSLSAILRQLEGTSETIGSTIQSKSSLGEESTAGKSDKDVQMEDGDGEKLSHCRLLDLEDLAFAQGSHFMANKKCPLPEGTFRKAYKGYEEIHVPPLKQRPMDPGEVSVKKKGKSVTEGKARTYCVESSFFSFSTIAFSLDYLFELVLAVIPLLQSIILMPCTIRILSLSLAIHC